MIRQLRAGVREMTICSADRSLDQFSCCYGLRFVGLFSDYDRPLFFGASLGLYLARSLKSISWDRFFP